MYKNGLVLMTAMPPTQGHLALIDFASSYVGSYGDERGAGTVFVVVSTRECEPLDGFGRFAALMHACDGMGNVVVLHSKGDVPQNPSEHPDFWNFWKDHINGLLKGLYDPFKPDDLLFASEMYGEPLAEVMDMQFIPYDVGRKIVDTKASRIRGNLLGYWDDIIPEYQTRIRQTVTIFGAESCGKTTMTKQLGQCAYITGHKLCTTVPEWARLYLETVGPTVDEKAMDRIMRGQFAVQISARSRATTPFIVQDTDLLSTIGYYRIMGIPVPDDILELFDYTNSNLYIVMNSNIPFEADSLRYGGDKRESSDQFWIDLLEEFQCKYYVVTNTDFDLQYSEVREQMENHFNAQFPDIATFVRT